MVHHAMLEVKTVKNNEGYYVTPNSFYDPRPIPYHPNRTKKKEIARKPKTNKRGDSAVDSRPVKSVGAQDVSPNTTLSLPVILPDVNQIGEVAANPPGPVDHAAIFEGVQRK